MCLGHLSSKNAEHSQLAASHVLGFPAILSVKSL